MQPRKIGFVAGFVAIVALLAPLGAALAFDESKYPDLKGQWHRTTAPRWELAKTAPLTPEYRAIYEANVKDQEEGGQGETPTFTCLSPGMPRVMNAYEPFEIVVTPQSTHFLMDHIHDSRRILTDGEKLSALTIACSRPPWPTTKNRIARPSHPLTIFVNVSRFGRPK